MEEAPRAVARGAWFLNLLRQALETTSADAGDAVVQEPTPSAASGGTILSATWPSAHRRPPDSGGERAADQVLANP
ncbi:MAG: hypothetical protein WBR18_00765, partial [Anaerolineales bacterium]